MLERDSASLGPARAAAGPAARRAAPGGGGGRRPAHRRARRARPQRPAVVRLARAGGGARRPGARVVLHLHNYRLVCAVGTCFTHGEDCTRCHGRNTLPGVRLNCRGGSRAESVVYGASLALWQRRLAGCVDAFVVPSAFALGRLRELGAPLGGRAHVIASVQRDVRGRLGRGGAGLTRSPPAGSTPEKGFADAIAACARRRRPARDRRRRPADGRAARARGGRRTCTFTGRVAPAELAALRRARGARDRALALRGDPAARRARGDGGGPAGGRRARRRARRAGAGRGPVPAAATSTR